MSLAKLLDLRLWDADYGWDDEIGGQISIPLDNLPSGKPVLQTVRLGKVSNYHNGTGQRNSKCSTIWGHIVSARKSKSYLLVTYIPAWIFLDIENDS